jgi:hypothetical protein
VLQALAAPPPDQLHARVLPGLKGELLERGGLVVVARPRAAASSRTYSVAVNQRRSVRPHVSTEKAAAFCSSAQVGSRSRPACISARVIIG